MIFQYLILEEHFHLKDFSNKNQNLIFQCCLVQSRNYSLNLGFFLLYIYLEVYKILFNKKAKEFKILG